MSTINIVALPWVITLGPEAEKELEGCPESVRTKFDRWVVAVQAIGPWQRSWRTEALKGKLKGTYSLRLSRKWRAIFEVASGRNLIVLGIIPHDYKSIERRF